MKMEGKKFVSWIWLISDHGPLGSFLGPENALKRLWGKLSEDYVWGQENPKF
jgi:hypothetical protein